MLPTYFEFQNAVKLLCGDSALSRMADELRHLGAERPLLLTDAVLAKIGTAALAERALAEEGCPAVGVFSEIPVDSSLAVVNRIASLYRDMGADALVAVGGGSVIDTAKGVRLVLSQEASDLLTLAGVENLNRGRHIPFIVVPTTAGTGSETTLAAVITDSEKHYKYPINDFSLIPLYAVLDYHETVGLPPQITATTGMDALTHAVEAYIGGSTTKETRAMAEEAVRLIHQHLKTAYENGQDKAARKGMLKAAYCAGVAFTKSYVGYVHAVAHSLGGQYGTPHGLANAVLLPIVLRMYGSSCEKRLARLARNAGVVDEAVSDAETAQRFIDWVQEMNDSMGIPRKLSGIQEEDIRLMAKHADKEGNPLYPVPKLMNRKELEAIYYAVKE